MNPRIRTIFLLPCLLTALCLAAPAQAATSWGSFSAMAALSCGPSGGDPGTTAVDTTATPPTAWQTGIVNVTLQGTGDHMDYKIDCGSIQTVANGASVPMALEGAHTISHRAVDAGGLATGWIDETVSIDTTAPVNTTLDQSGWHTTPSVNVTVQGTDTGGSGIGHVEWSGDSTGNGASGSPVSVTGEGSHSLTTVVEDAVGNRSAPRTDTIQIDSIAPVDVTAYPSGWQYSATTIDLYGTDTGGSGVARVEWKIDGGSVNTGLNHSSIPMAEGTHVLSTQIVDTAGNASGFVDHTIQVDLTGPSDDTTVPAGWVPTPQNIVVKGTDPLGAGVQQVRWELDGVAGSGANNSVVPVIADADHILKTAVNDGHGWTGWKTQHVKIDSLVPTDVTAVSGGWKTSAQTVNVTGTDATSGIEHVEWQLTGPTSSSGQSTTNGAAVLVSGDGTWTLSTRVVDYAGNPTGWKQSIIRIDTTAPNNLTALPPTTWSSASSAVALDGTDGGSGFLEMHWKLDANAEQHGPAGTVVNVSGTGTHHLISWVVDVAGNASGQRDDVINIDTLAPTDTTVAPPATVTNHSTFPVTGTDAHAGVDHVEWQLDNGGVHQGPSGTLASIDGRDGHVLHTRVIDAAGNASGWTNFSVFVDVTGDAVPPTDTTPDIATGWHRQPSVTVPVTATDAGSGVYKVEWRLDGSSVQSGDSGTQVTITGEGHHDFETRAWDVNDNDSLWKYQDVKIDSVTPADTSTLPTDWTKDQTFTLGGTDATSGVDHIEYQIDGGTISTPVGDTATVGPIVTDGPHAIRHRVVDVAGQASGWKTDNIKIDTVKPVNTSPAAPAGWKKSISLTLTGTDADSKFDHGEWRLDGGDPQTGPVSVTTDGTYTLETRVLDNAGNPSDWSAPQTIKVDGTVPTNTTVAPSAAWLKDTFTTTVAGSDAGSGVASVEWTLDGGPTQTTPAVTASTAGAHVLRSRITDTAGNVSAWRDMSFGIDRTAPGLAVDCGSDAWRASAVGCNIAGDGGESGLNTLTVTRNGGAAEAIASGAGYTVAEDGDWTLTVRGTDVAGNAATTTTHVRVDHTAPSAGLDCVADGGSAYACRASGADGLSGLASLTYSVDGGPPQTPAADGSFTVAKGRVVVHATDAAGNGANSRALILSDRVVRVVQIPREVSEAILRSGRGSAIFRAVGELSLKSTSRRTSVYLRPLALGKGRFRITMKLRADKQRKTYRKTVKTRKGYTPRISVRMGGAARVTVDLTIRRKSHKRWKAYASAGAELG